MRNTGKLYPSLNEFSKAKVEFKKIMEINLYHADAHYGLGLSYESLEQPGLAKKHFVKTIEYSRNNKVVKKVHEKI